MEMHQVRYFLAVARLLNFTRAAEACNVSQPSLTRAIQKLEDELGGPLFHRERTLTHLTSLGRSMQPHLEQMLAAADAARRTATDLQSTQLAPLTIGIAAMGLSKELQIVFGELAKNIQGLQLQLHFACSAKLVQAMVEGEIELAVIAQPHAPPERLDSWRLYRRRICVVTQLNHRLTDRPVVSLADLRDEVLIHSNEDGSHLLEREAARIGITADFRHRTGCFDQAKTLVLAGLGCAVVAHPGDLAGDVAVVPLDDTVQSLDIVLATMAGRRKSHCVEAFIKAARARAWLDQ